jgi:hypothetical protein
MAKRKRSQSRRQTYVAVSKETRKQLKEYAKFVPSLEKIKPKRNKLGTYVVTPAQQAQITRARKQLRHTENLKRLTKKQAAQLKKAGKADLLVGKGVRAIRLRNTSPDAKVRVTKSGVIVTSNGREWEYHRVPAEPDELIERGIEFLNNPRYYQINLWITRGRANEGFRSKSAWVEYIRNRFTQYVSQTDFVEGIAVLVKPKELKGGGK